MKNRAQEGARRRSAGEVDRVDSEVRQEKRGVGDQRGYDGEEASGLAGSEHMTPAGGNVFADLGFPPDEAENLKIRAQLMSEVQGIIKERGLTQTEAAVLFGVKQPRISDLVRGKIGLFTIDALINMLAHAGIAVRVQVADRAA